jgi:hypothetical protein
MKKGILSVLFLAAAFLALIQPVSAWAAPNHYAIAEQVYYALPSDAQENLNLSEMIDGSDDPDFKFFDFQYHHYPASQEKANYWLEKGREYYADGEYNPASYCFGVATHYLSDSVCPPHSGGGHSGYEHTKCEVQAVFLQPHITVNNGDMGISLLECNQMSGNAWDQWLKTGDNKYIQQCLDRSADVSYLAVKSAISS